MDQSNEIWKPVTISPYEDFYEVSSHGRVRSVDRIVQTRSGGTKNLKGRMMGASPNARGYLRVSLYKDDVGLTRTVHTLVAKAFIPDPVGDAPAGSGGWTVNHIDGNKLNNVADNLEYITSSENMKHAWSNKLICHAGVKNSQTSLTDQDIRDIRSAYDGGESQASIRRRYGIGSPTVSYIVRRITWQHVR